MGIRTPDLLIANETLYQLSYTPNEKTLILTSPHFNPPATPITTTDVRFLKIHVDAESVSDAASSAKPSPQSDEYVPGSP